MIFTMKNALSNLKNFFETMVKLNTSLNFMYIQVTRNIQKYNPNFIQLDTEDHINQIYIEIDRYLFN